MAAVAQDVDNSERSPIVDLFSAHEHFCRVAIDAYVLVNQFGKVLRYNSHFTKMAKVKPRQLAKANSLDDIIALTVDDRQISILEILRYRSTSHLERATGTLVAEGDQLKLVIGVMPFRQDDKPLGAFLLIRDITAETNLQDKYQDKATESITDRLTGLFNRGYLDQFLPDYLDKVENMPIATRHMHASLLILDIDHFKKCNDTHGHAAGDYVIAEVAKILKKSVRKTDTTCRYGGEEFIAILPECAEGDAIDMANTIRKKIQDHHFEFSGTKISVTVSIGVVEVGIGRESPNEALARADSALYHAKHSGRNAVFASTLDGQFVGGTT